MENLNPKDEEYNEITWDEYGNPIVN